ncbi:hypothetical protein EB118_12595 [bacterium]|nr:hypothetical protein [bacterium]
MDIENKYRSSDLSVVKNLINQYEQSDTDSESMNTESMVSCRICHDNMAIPKSNYIILGCNHTFHVLCLAEAQFTDIYKFPSIDGDYFTNRTCQVCRKPLQPEELMYLHSKFLSSTKEHIHSHDTKIGELEKQLANIKGELRVCYEYKHKLEQQREKSKQIVSILNVQIQI